MVDHKQHPQDKQNRICKFFGTSKGCRAGEGCPYKHEAIHAPSNASSQHEAPAERTRRLLPVDKSKIVTKPQPATEDVRAFHTGQIQRRFRPTVSQQGQVDQYTFDMVPSDPDFPYDIDTLRCRLDIPFTYPRSGSPTLSVLNKDIPRGFQINIERGFAMLAQNNPAATLLGLMNRLDRQLETILSGDMAETIKIVVSKSTNIPSQTSRQPSEKQQGDSHPINTWTSFTEEQKHDAKHRRELETRQLEARFGRMPAFVKSSNGLQYTLPLDSPKKASWPGSLQPLQVCKLIVPEAYPLETTILDLASDTTEARNVCEAFSHKAVSSPSLTLTQLVNFLLINLKDMSMQPVLDDRSKKSPGTTAKQLPFQSKTEELKDDQMPIPDPDRPHILFVQRPPEWSLGPRAEEGEEASTSDDDTESDGEVGSADEPETQGQSFHSTTLAERGVLLSFPQLEMHGIELLELTMLSLTVRCTRCKESMDVERIQSTITDDTTSAKQPRTENCKKCVQPFIIGFRADLMHLSSVRAGYLDLDGCTPVDVLPSSFTPTCSECSTPHPSVIAVRGESVMAICRTCHRKMSLRIQEERFLRVSAAATTTSRLPTRRTVKEKLGIVAGTELPRRGRCSHYGKSYRWFRFSCCNKVFPCDRCHDTEVDHPNEHANRMICGFCSREQNYRPEDCGICHSVLIGKRGHGFWEGGKGTRDKARMSRKDPRKYKRVGGGQPRKS